MDFSSLSPVAMIVLLIGAATPILLAAIGELVVEKAGVLNLGVEGMMIIGAVCGFIVAVNTDSPMLGLLGAAVGGAVVSMVFAFLTQYLLSNQVATGLALTLFGLDIITALSAAGTSLANVGPGLGDVGPAGNFKDLPDGVKWILSYTMLLGRLEIFAVLIFFLPNFWK